MAADKVEDPWVKRLRDAAEAGERLDLAADLPQESPDRNPAHAQSWGTDRQLPAAALRAVLLDRTLSVDPRGLRINGARITGPVDLENVQFEHPLHLTESHIAHDIDLSGSKLKELNLSRSHITSLNLTNATVIGDVFARDGFTAAGTIRAAVARIGGMFDLSGAILINPGGIALDLDGATVIGDLFARDRFAATGTIRAPCARIGGMFDLSGAILNTNGIALDLGGATVTGGLGALDGFTATGAIEAPGASFAVLVLSGATLINPGGIALLLDGATVIGDLFARDRFAATGTIRARASIGGQLDLSGAILTNTNPDGFALDLDGATVTGDLFARDGFTATGAIRALSATVGGQLDLSGATLANPGGIALNLEGATVAGLRLTPTKVDGKIALTRATITDLRTPDNSLPPGQLIAIGWQVTDMHGQIRTNRAAATAWLKTTPSEFGFTVQPWHTLAAVYDRNGQPADARRLRFTAANQVTKQAPRYSKPLRWTYLAVAGHGYYPLLAALWLVAALILGTVLVSSNRADFVPTDPAAAHAAATAHAHNNPGDPPPSPITANVSCRLYPDYPCFNRVNYTLTNVVPAALGNQKTDWTTKSQASLVLSWGLPILRILSWVFTAILLAGVTGLLRKT
ncbi:hypothetical protein [Nocardia sp. NPDC050710]|uniref:hypothetical protein n=1 Tax=Nocardia sp. NPDC050710 TaxID=3157220 RepID=UPI00340068EC